MSTYTFKIKNNPTYIYFAHGDPATGFHISGVRMSGYQVVHEVEHHEPDPQQLTLKQWCRKKYENAGPLRALPSLTPGAYHPRIWRPGLSFPIDQLASEEAETQSIVSVSSLLERLLALFRTVEPVPANEKVYGHEIRHLLLLASMEVESSFAAVLKANRYQIGNRWTIKDYVKLQKAMLLDTFSVRLRKYPSYPPLRPFRSWKKSRPAQSLAWWSAYNSTKHDREANLSQGSLDHALNAIAASVIMLFAQFGTVTGRAGSTSLIAQEFSISISRLPAPQFFYVPNSDKNWIPSNYRF